MRNKKLSASIKLVPTIDPATGIITAIRLMRVTPKQTQSEWPNSDHVSTIRCDRGEYLGAK